MPDACIGYVVDNAHRACAAANLRYTRCLADGACHSDYFAVEYFALNYSTVSFTLLDDYYRNLIRSC